MPFPKFDDGDVEIQLSLNESHCYKLHSFVLALHSPFFKASLSEKWNRGNSSSPSASSPKCWAYELRFTKGTSEGILVRKSEEDTSSELIDLTAENIYQERRFIHAHEEFLALFYNKPLGWDMKKYYQYAGRIEALLDVGDMYGGLQLVTNPIEKELLYGQGSVLQVCASEPSLIMNLAMRLKCKWLYREAATHLLGRSDHSFEQQLIRLKTSESSEGIAVMLTQRRKDFVNELRGAEHKLMMIAPKDDGRWSSIAVAFFRQRLALRISTLYEGSGLDSGYAKLYHDISKKMVVASHTITRQEMQAQLRLLDLPVSEENLKRFDEALTRILLEAAGVLKSGILINNARKPIDVADAHRALTFCLPRETQYPWMLKEGGCSMTCILSEDEGGSDDDEDGF
ncbi:MAG: hypothetical protein M1820_002589 [Bogoriella megaspora]|nr:MAG: hypothetical protein M1820_002589 [Bogoriella megaspora]